MVSLRALHRPWTRLVRAELSTKHDFQLQRDKGLPPQLIPFMRLCYCQEESELKSIDLKDVGELTAADEAILAQVVQYLQHRLARCGTSAVVMLLRSYNCPQLRSPRFWYPYDDDRTHRIYSMAAFGQ